MALLGVAPSFNFRSLMKKLAFVFAGQGSQYQGMGLDFVHDSKDLIKLEHKADDLLGFHTRELITQGGDIIHQTRYTQPLVLLSSIYAYLAVKQCLVEPDGVLGFSLGEYTALFAAGIFSFEEMIELVNFRALLMEDSSLKNPGQMAAILGLSSEQVIAMCQDIQGPIYPANFNSLQQTVISGTVEMMDIAEKKAKELGAKRFIRLQVSGAFHSSLMKEASLEFEQKLKKYHPKTPTCDVYLNTTGKPLDIDTLKVEMVNQIISPVQFVKAIQNMKKDGFTHFVEIGPGTTLSGLIKKIDMDLEVTHVEKLTDIEQLKGWFINHGFIQ